MANKEFDKEDEKILRAYCRKLPLVFENTCELHVMTGQELLDMGYVLEDGRTIDPEEKYEYKMPVRIAVNHYRRLKIAWINDREAGVDHYIKGLAKLIDEDARIKNKPSVIHQEAETDIEQGKTKVEYGRLIFAVLILTAATILIWYVLKITQVI